MQITWHPALLLLGAVLATIPTAPSAPLFENNEVKVVRAFARGPVVTVERFETMHAPGKPERHLPVVGFFAFKDGKIAEWYDYVPKDG